MTSRFCRGDITFNSFFRPLQLPVRCRDQLAEQGHWQESFFFVFQFLNNNLDSTQLKSFKSQVFSFKLFFGFLFIYVSHSSEKKSDH